MSAILETTPTQEKVFPQTDFRSNRPTEVPYPLIQIDPTPLFTEIDEPKEWDEKKFHDSIRDAHAGDRSAVNIVVETSIHAIQTGNLATALIGISEIYKGQTELQAQARDILMRQYSIFINESGQGVDNYVAGTILTNRPHEFRPKNGITFEAIDPMYQPNVKEE